jgi:ArsR family transcriptional regulator
MYLRIFDLHANLLKSISHPKRLEIIHLLRNQKLSVNEIQKMLDLPQANLSQHLMVLRKSGVVGTEKSGKVVNYFLLDNRFVKASDLMRDILIERHRGSKLADEFTKKMTDLVPLTSDVVCGMKVSPKTASYARKHKGKNYYFCASGCFSNFKKDPDSYLT